MAEEQFFEKYKNLGNSLTKEIEKYEELSK
jgi:hypothetical protein